MSEIYNSWNMRQINHMTATHKRILRNLIYPQRRSLKYFTVGCLGGQITLIRLRKKINLIQIIFDFLGLNSNWKSLDFIIWGFCKKTILLWCDSNPVPKDWLLTPWTPYNTAIYAPHRKLNICLLHGLAFNQKRHFGTKLF